MMKELKVLEEVKELSIEVYHISDMFPNSENYNLTQQIRRAILSVRLNIREGNSFYDNNKIRFFKIALASLREVDECIEFALDLRYIKNRSYDLFKEKYYLCLNMLKKLIDSIIK